MRGHALQEIMFKGKNSFVVRYPSPMQLAMARLHDLSHKGRGKIQVLWLFAPLPFVGENTSARAVCTSPLRGRGRPKR